MARHLLAAVPWVAMAFCILGFYPWVLGVPGVEGSSYADGWTLGLYAIMLYPAFMLAVLLARLLRRLTGLGLSPQLALPVSWLAFGALVVTQAIAWSQILA